MWRKLKELDDIIIPGSGYVGKNTCTNKPCWQYKICPDLHNDSENLGDINGSEGVFGLQRGFKMAGVHYLIVSLWKVPDAETADFMQTFYSKWLKDKNEIKDAFRKTQLEMSDKYKEPFKWAAFTLIE